MLEIVAGVVALISLGVSLALARRLQQLDGRLRATEQELIQNSKQAMPVLPATPPVRPLEGLRIALAITQDHPHAVFANLLKEQLLTEDVGEVSILTANGAEALLSSWETQKDGPDILIAGKLTCNGYAEIYYDADFTCSTSREAICTLDEKPLHGDRPGNLAIELVTRLKTELEKLISRSERRAAIRELRGERPGS